MLLPLLIVGHTLASLLSRDRTVRHSHHVVLCGGAADVRTRGGVLCRVFAAVLRRLFPPRAPDRRGHGPRPDPVCGEPRWAHPRPPAEVLPATATLSLLPRRFCCSRGTRTSSDPGSGRSTCSPSRRRCRFEATWKMRCATSARTSPRWCCGWQSWAGCGDGDRRSPPDGHPASRPRRDRRVQRRCTSGTRPSPRITSGRSVGSRRSSFRPRSCWRPTSAGSSRHGSRRPGEGC